MAISSPRMSAPHHRHDAQHQDDLRERRQRVHKPVPDRLRDAVARRPRQRTNESTDHNRNTDTQYRQRNVKPRRRKHPHQQIAPQVIGAKQKRRAGRLQGLIDETVGVVRTQ